MRARLPLVVGVVVPLVFVVVLLIEGLTRPGYNSWRDMGSSLSTGPGGWMQIVNFIACGLLITVPAAALARSHPPTTWGPRRQRGLWKDARWASQMVRSVAVSRRADGKISISPLARCLPRPGVDPLEIAHRQVIRLSPSPHDRYGHRSIDSEPH